ncbi:MAG: HupE/UreJ family protein [Gammaproteobacteria bacterium]|nr:HupE/UreJ family protein [Gammaproteobacteria bacterium]
MRIVTAFTVAHSFSLTLAVLQILVPPARLVEIAIAASVVLAGLLNLYPPLVRRAVAIAFAFGLVHGFGFANVLLDLGLHDGALAVSLAGFNVGVELGQIAIVGVLLPILFHLRRRPSMARRFVPAASLATSLLAMGWLLERMA